MIRTALITAATIFSLSVPGHAQQSYDANTVLATVNGEEITLGRVIALLERLPQYQQLDDEQLYSGILDQLITQTLIAQQESASPEEDTLRMRLTLANERVARLAQDAIDRVAREPIEEAALQAAFDAKYGEVEKTVEYNARHILVKTEEEANAIVEDLNGGADFAATAAEKSTGPSGPNGGDLGWFGPGRMIPAFEEAVAAMEPGQISAPVETQYGWHVIKLEDTRMVPSLESTREELEEPLRRAAVDAYIASMSESDAIVRNEVDIPASAIRQIELLDAE